MKLLQDFAQAHNLHDFAPDVSGRRALLIDDWTVSVFPAGQSLYLEAGFGPLPPERPGQPDPLSDLLRHALADAVYHREALTVCEQSPAGADQLCLLRALPLAGLGREDFEQALAAFANRLQIWRKRLAVSSAVPSREVAAAPSAAFLIFP